MKEYHEVASCFVIGIWMILCVVIFFWSIKNDR